MADLGGFTTTFPTDDPGGDSDPVHDEIIARKFTAGGAGAQVINKIGVYIGDRQSTGDFRFIIYTDGAGEPGSIVANSLTSEVNVPSAGWISHSYSTKPQITGGTDYWLGIWGDNAGGPFEIGVDVIVSTGTQQTDAETYQSTGSPGTASWSNYAHAIQVAAEYQAAGGVTHDVSAADAIKLSDTSAISLIIQGLSSDVVDLSDIAAGALTIAVIGADSMDLSDAPIAEGILSLSAADGIDLSDATIAEATLSLAAIDGVDLSDTSIAERIVSILAADGIKFLDSSGGIFNFTVTAEDGLVLSDVVATILNLLVSVSDGIKLSDISTDVSVAVSGKMVVTISSKSARIRFEGKMANIDLTSKKPRIKFEGV